MGRFQGEPGRCWNRPAFTRRLVNKEKGRYLIIMDRTLVAVDAAALGEDLFFSKRLRAPWRREE